MLREIRRTLERGPREMAAGLVTLESPLPLLTLAMAVLLLIGMRRFQGLVPIVSGRTGLALMFQRPPSIPGVFLMAAQRVTPAKVALLLDRGKSAGWIARRFGLHRTTIPKMVARAREGTPLFRQKRPEGAPHPSQKADLAEIRRVLSETWGNVMLAARRLKMRRNNLEKRIVGEDLDQWVAGLRKAGTEARRRAAAVQKELVRERAAQDLTKSATLASRRPPRPSPRSVEPAAPARRVQQPPPATVSPSPPRPVRDWRQVDAKIAEGLDLGAKVPVIATRLRLSEAEVVARIHSGSPGSELARVVQRLRRIGRL